VTSGAPVSYGALRERVDAIAQTLDAAPGERVGVLAPNSTALLAGLFAVWQRGAVAVPLGARLRSYELSRALADSQAVELVGVERHRGFSFADLGDELFDAAPALRRCHWLDEHGHACGDSARPDAATGELAPLEPGIAAILYTSGSTGEPKGALVAHASALAGARSSAAVLGLDAGERALIVVPATHAFGLIVLLATIASGGRAVMAEPSPSPRPLADAIERESVRVLHGSPALFAALTAGATDALTRLRGGFVAGAHCPPPLLERLDDSGARILNMYGMTEIGAATACRPDDPAAVRHHTTGRPLPGYEVRVEDGEVQVRSEHVTPGYHGRTEQTAAAFDGDWFRTGDLGSVDAAGNLTISGRRKELVNIGGHNVFPGEVEGLLGTHPDVAQAVVWGVPHERMGEVLRGSVVLRDGADTTPAELVRFARERLAGYKVPYGVEVVDELPLLASGKPDRAALREDSRKVADAIG